MRIERTKRIACWLISGASGLCACASTVSPSTEDGGTAPPTDAQTVNPWTDNGETAPDTDAQTVVSVWTGAAGPSAPGAGFDVIATLRGQDRTVACQTADDGRCALRVASDAVLSITVARARWESVSVAAPLPPGELRVVTRPLQEAGRETGPLLRFEPSTSRASLLSASGGSFILPAFQGVALSGFAEAGTAADFVASTVSFDGDPIALSVARALTLPSAIDAIRLPAPQPVGLLAREIVLDLSGAARIATGALRARVELDQPAGAGAYGKGAFYQSPTRCEEESPNGASWRCSFGLVDHPEFRAPWVHLALGASGANAASIQVSARLGAEIPRVAVSFPALPSLRGERIDALQLDASGVVGRAVSLEVEPTASSGSGTVVWVVHYPAARATSSLSLAPMPADFAARVRATSAQTVDVRVRVWSPDVTAPWAPETYALSPRASVVSRPVTLPL